MLARLESSMLLLSNLRAAGIHDSGQRHTATYVAAFDGQQMVGVAAHAWNHNLLLQAPVHVEALWRAAVEISGRPLRGVIGPQSQVAAVLTGLDIPPSSVQVDEPENLYSLNLADLVLPDGLVNGQVQGHQAQPHHVEVLTRWGGAYGVETLGEEPSAQLEEQQRLAAERRIRARQTWVLEEQGLPVAMSSFNATLAEAVQVGGVYTPPEQRSRGYARCVVAASLRDAHVKGIGKGVLFTGETNFAAQRAYRALGFQKIGDYRILLFRTPVG